MRLSLWRFVRQVILQGRDENGFGRLPGGPPRHRIYLSTAALKVLGDGRTLLSSARTGKSSFSDEAFGSSARALRRRRYKGLAALGYHKHSSFFFAAVRWTIRARSTAATVLRTAAQPMAGTPGTRPARVKRSITS